MSEATLLAHLVRGKLGERKWEWMKDAVWAERCRWTKESKKRMEEIV